MMSLNLCEGLFSPVLSPWVLEGQGCSVSVAFLTAVADKATSGSLVSAHDLRGLEGRVSWWEETQATVPVLSLFSC